MTPLVHLHIRNPKTDETPIESATQIFSSALPYPFLSLWKRILLVHPKTYSFELFLLNQLVYFYATVPAESETFIQSLIGSSFPQSKIDKTTDPMKIVFKSPRIDIGQMMLTSYSYLPIKTYFDFKDVDPLSATLGFMAKQPPHIRMAVQIAITPPYFPWQEKGVKSAGEQIYDEGSEKYVMNPQKMAIMRKATFQGGKTAIRLVVGSTHTGDDPKPYLTNLAGTFGAYSLGEGNQFILKRPVFFKDALVKRIQSRQISYFECKNQVLNAQELASMWHPPGILLGGLKNISWGKTLIGEAPENLPIVDGMDEANKQKVNFFAKTEFRNKPTIFGIKEEDRRKHVYIVGKTGAGKSTLIANMAIDDIRKGRGVGVIDPHGDLCETILNYIPKRRINDVVYLEPFDTERPFALNVLEMHGQQHKDLVSSGIVAIFSKLYKDSWGPRLEYILRNVILTLLNVPGSTLTDVLSILSQVEFRRKTVSQLTDTVLKGFWELEFAKMSEKLRSEAVSPIQNKVGQFVTSTMIRNIVGRAKSTINLEEIMNGKKILLLNLSQGKLGEDNASLLGAMIITQIQLAAMNRAFIDEKERQDFFLYVDEFQNFATSTFIKILSEARKYRLSLTLTNQYIGQLDEDIEHAIFGNVGSLMSFVVGARDAHMLSLEYGELYTENDLVALEKFEMVLKLSIDNMTSLPFPSHTLPLPASKNENREKIIRLSKEKYGYTPEKTKQ